MISEQHQGTIVWPEPISGRLNTSRRRQQISMRSIAGALALSCAAGALSGVGPPCPYTVSVAGNAPNCGFWGYSILNPTSINNLGHWVGYRNKCPDNLDEIPIKWTPEGGLVNIPMPPQTSRCWAYGINDLGTVVGARVGVTDGQSHGDWACVWLPNGEFIEIPPLAGGTQRSYAWAVNNQNWVVGERGQGAGVTFGPFIWTSNGIVDISPLPISTYGTARDVSDTGYVVGQIGVDSNGTGRGFRWKDGVVEILQPLPGAITSDAKAVNDAGVVFGQCRFGEGSATYSRAARWGLDGVPIELPPLPGHMGSLCTAVSNDGTVLGRSRANSSASSAVDVVWIDGVPYKLKDYLSTPTPNQYSGARAINDLGQISSVASFNPGFGVWILTPTGSMADLNGDCIVDGTDLSLLLQQWGTVPDAPASADLNDDGKVDGADLGTLLSAWTGVG